MGTTRWAVLVSAVCLVVAVAAVAYAAGKAKAAPVAEVVRARGFEVVDASGVVRAVLSAAQDGGAGVVVSDARGKARLRLEVSGDGATGLSLLDEVGKTRLRCSLAKGSAGLGLENASKKRGAWLAIGEDGDTRLVMSESGGNTSRMALSLEQREGGVFPVLEMSSFGSRWEANLGIAASTVLGPLLQLRGPDDQSVLSTRGLETIQRPKG